MDEVGHTDFAGHSDFFTNNDATGTYPHPQAISPPERYSITILNEYCAANINAHAFADTELHADPQRNPYPNAHPGAVHTRNRLACLHHPTR